MTRGTLGIVLVLGLMGGCAGPDPAPPDTADAGDLTGGRLLVVYVAGLADPSTGFFRVLNNGAQQAGRDLGVEVRYVYPASVDLASYTQKNEEILVARPDGLVLLDIGNLEAVARRASAAGVALALNPAPPAATHPLRDPEDVYVARVGADEFAAGALAARRMIDGGARSLVCVQQNVGDGTQTERCRGLAETAASAGMDYDHVAGNPDPGQTAAIVEAYLRAHPDVDGVLATGQPATAGVVAACQSVGREPMQTAGFDVSPDIVAMIQAGDLDFTMDQQGWWRGYVSVMELVHYLRYGLVQSNYFLTGPQIVDAGNADEVAALAERGIR